MDCLQWLRGRKSYAFYFTLIVSGISDCLTSSIQMLFILGSLEVVIFALSRGGEEGGSSSPVTLTIFTIAIIVQL